MLECDDTNMADLNDSDKMLYIDLFSFFCLGFITAVCMTEQKDEAKKTKRNQIKENKND